MIRLATPAVALFGLVLAAVGPAQAQYGGYGPRNNGFPSATGYPNQAPLLSPYLNLLRGGDAASNYYLGVVPERDRRFNNVQNQNAFRQLDQRYNQLATEGEEFIPRIPSTGHSATFLTYSPYYNLPGAGRFAPAPLQSSAGAVPGGAAPGGAAPARPRQP